MKIIKKRISAVLLSIYMVFGVVSTDYLTVQAFEWVVPSLTVGDSILWLMGLLGIAYTEGASAWRDVSPEYEQDFIDYANEHGLTYTETSTWLNDTASGKLNQLSEVWTNFKEWVKSKFTSGSSSGDIITDNSFSNICSIYNSTYGINIKGSASSSASDLISAALLVFSGSDRWEFFAFKDTGDYSIQKNDSGNYTVYKDNLIYSGSYLYSASWYNGSVSTPAGNFRYAFPTTNILHCFNMVWDSSFANIDSIGGLTSSDSDNVYNPALIPEINFAGANTEDASIPGVIDLPWGNLGDDEEERDKTYDDLVGGLDLGKEIGDLWQALQDLMGVLAVDDAGVLQPNSGGENPPTLEDEAENNKVNGAFVLTGLQKVFPFCIPFDLYAFITLLEAPPVAPVIQYPIYNPVTKSNEIITIDFSTWESVVVLFRYIFDFLFIIGLLLMARALIGGGDSA